MLTDSTTTLFISRIGNYYLPETIGHAGLGRSIDMKMTGTPRRLSRLGASA